jgi:phosphopantetheine attachment domain protein
MNIKNELLNIITDLGIVVDENETIQDIDSLTFVSLVVKIEEKFNITFPDEFLLLDMVKDISNLVIIIEQQLEE